MGEAWTELCEIIEENPNKLSEKVGWICRQCPQPNLLYAESARLSRSHLNAVLAVARIISRNVDTTENHGKFVVLGFLQAMPKSFHRSFWPESFALESISAFYCSFLGYLSLEFSTQVVELTVVAISCNRDPAISKAFLVALSQNFPPSIRQSDGDKLITVLLHQFAENHSHPDEVASHASSNQSSMSAVVNGGSLVWESDVDKLNSGFSQQVVSFEHESIESLEKQEIVFRLITHILDKVKVDSKLHDQVSSIAKRQLHSMSAFLKVMLFVATYHMVFLDQVVRVTVLAQDIFVAIEPAVGGIHGYRSH